MHDRFDRYCHYCSAPAYIHCPVRHPASIVILTIPEMCQRAYHHGRPANKWHEYLTSFSDICAHCTLHETMHVDGWCLLSTKRRS
jgi:hypothetical protein